MQQHDTVYGHVSVRVVEYEHKAQFDYWEKRVIVFIGKWYSKLGHKERRIFRKKH